MVQATKPPQATTEAAAAWEPSVLSISDTGGRGLLFQRALTCPDTTPTAPGSTGLGTWDAWALCLVTGGLCPAVSAP